MNYFQTVTISTADPAIFTCVDHGLKPGDEIILETTGALPTGLYAHNGTTYPEQSYFVIRDGITSSTFQVSTEETEEYNGDPAATTGAGSGTHTFLKISHDYITPESIIYK
jgi:hypothetical protein